MTIKNIRARRAVNLRRYVEPSKRLIAAEIELCGFKRLTSDTGNMLNTVFKAWGVSGVHDGSLPDGGIELNTHPAAGKYWVDQITNIMSVVHAAGGWVDQRAGCHIHVDCRSIGYFGLAKAVRLFGCLEPALFNIIPIYRRKSNYCLFWALNYLKALQTAELGMSPSTSERKVTLLYRKELLRAIYGFHSKREVDNAKQSKNGGNRYRALNLHSYLHRGTIEVRMPPGTIYPENVINWGLLVSHIVDYAQDHSMFEIMDVCKDVEVAFTTHGDLAAPVLKDSVKLLLTLAPSPVVRDWIIERRKWANRFPDASMFKESAL